MVADTNRWNLRSFVLICGLILFCFLVADVSAELVWQNTQQRRSVDVEQGQLVFSFRFQNAGIKPVEITKMRSSCSCLGGVLEKNIYAPGESGVLKAVVSLDGREGLLKKSLMVLTDAQPDKPTKLGVTVNVPKGYKLSTQRLVWEGAGSEAKTCRLVNRSKKSILLTFATCASPDFTVELIPVREGFEYEVKVCPTVRSSMQSHISIFTALPKDGSIPRKYSLYAERKQRCYRPN